MKKIGIAVVSLFCGVICATPVFAQSPVAGRSPCAGLPSQAQLRAALVAARNTPNGGFNLDMWGTIVNRDGVVCAVAFTGGNRGDQWPGSRAISAQKANTANAFSLPGLALSTANLYSATQPGGSLYGLQHSNPVDVGVAYGGNSANNGQPNDPMVGGKVGGVNVFGGGLGLYASGGQLIGALGVSGDSSCADHNIAWKTRHLLKLDYVPGGVSGDAARPDNIVYDITPQPGQMPGVSAFGWGHPTCSDAAKAIAASLPPVPTPSAAPSQNMRLK
ncbi:MAG: heme-binding protein [Methylocystis sp.]|uniref:GlcG/HbpS family heme-binding protein n=1 Tax=Methylocystis sp. TaxID=1911079 RepID=UPI00396189AF